MHRSLKTNARTRPCADGAPRSAAPRLKPGASNMDQATIRRAVMAGLEAVGAPAPGRRRLFIVALCSWLFHGLNGPPFESRLPRGPTYRRHDHAMSPGSRVWRSLAGVLYMFLCDPARASIVASTVVAEIDTLVVNGAFRRQHIGTRSCTGGAHRGSVSGATRTELGSDEFNEQARAFRASVGFKTSPRRLVPHSGSFETWK